MKNIRTTSALLPALLLGFACTGRTQVLNGDHLSFSQMAGTKMACMESMETENAFVNALTQVKTWKIPLRKGDSNAG